MNTSKPVQGDLHCHTRFSDGSLQPEALVDYAARLGLDCIAVTDHDTMSGVRRAKERGKARGVAVIPGVEVSTLDKESGRKAHLLCYLPQNPRPLLELCDETLRKRQQASLSIIEKLSARYPIDRETVDAYTAGGVIYKQHIMAALMDMGYSLSLYGELYDELLSPKRGWAYAEPTYPEPIEALKLIKETGGIAVLAHPGVYTSWGLIEGLCCEGLDGIEVNHPRQKIEDCERAALVAKEKALLPTGGSDFHGLYGSRVNPLANRTAPADTVKLLLSRLQGFVE